MTADRFGEGGVLVVPSVGAAVALEVGKNRMESLGEVQETADLIAWYCAQMEQNAGYDRILPQDPLAAYVSRNRSVLKPYGVWAVIAPFKNDVTLTLTYGPGIDRVGRIQDCRAGNSSLMCKEF